MAYVRKYYGYAEASRQEDNSNNELIQEVQQQILLYKECTNKKLQKIEELIELVVKKMNLLKQMQVEKRGERFVSPFGWKANVRHDRTMQQPSVTPDALHHLESRLPKFRGTEVFECSEDSEHQEFTGEEPIYDAALETCTRKPIYDEEQGEGQECWPEQDFILAAINRGNLKAPNSFQSEICRSGRSEELAEFSNNVMQPSREEKYLEKSAMDPYIFRSLGSSTTNCMTAPGNSLTWSTEDMDVPSVGNNSNGKLELNGLSPFLDETGIYNDVRNPPEPSMPAKEAVHDWKLVLMAENAHFLKFDDLSSPLSCPGELEWTESDNIHASHTCDMKLWFLMTANSHGLRSLAIYYENRVFIFDPGGGHVQNTNLKGVIIKLIEKIRPKVTLDNVVIIISICGQLAQLQDMICWKLKIDQLMKEHQLRKKVFMIQMVNSDRIQGVGHHIFKVSEINQQHVDIVRAGMKVIPKYSPRRQLIPERDRITRLEDHETSRESVKRNIFDPGGYIICVYEAELVGGTAGILYDQQLLQEIFIGKQLLLKGQEGMVVEVLTEMYVIQVKRSLEMHDPP